MFAASLGISMPENKAKRAARNRRHYLKRTKDASGNCSLCGIYESRRRKLRGLSVCVDCYVHATLRRKAVNFVTAVAERRDLYVNIARSEDAEEIHNRALEERCGPEGYPLDHLVKLVLYVSRNAAVKDDEGNRVSVVEVLKAVRRQAHYVDN